MLSEGPLEELLVIDFTQMMSGPYATMLLADMGAEVVKVEPPAGDDTRKAGPARDGDALAFGSYFQSLNRNKKSVVLDLKSKAGVKVARDLIRRADVVVENFRPDVMDRLGLGYEELRKDNPSLVYASVRGFGDPRLGASPYTYWPAYDVTAQAMGGVMYITGEQDGKPTKVGPGIGDMFPGVLLALGIVSAVMRARADGEGQYVDVAMYDGILSLCERIVYEWSYGGYLPARSGNSHPLVGPFGMFETLDGYVTIAAPWDGMWTKLCEVMGRSDAAVLYPTHVDRSRNLADVREIVGDWTRLHRTAEILEALGGLVPVGPVQSAADIFSDEHVWNREMLVSIEHPGATGPRVIAGCPIKFSETPAGVRTRAPLLGEHTTEVLRRFSPQLGDEEQRVITASSEHARRTFPPIVGGGPAGT